MKDAPRTGTGDLLIRVQAIEPLCIPQIADNMIAFNKSFSTKTNKFINRIKRSFEIDKLTKKLETFYNYDFKEFLSELKKKKITLSLKDQDEWEDYFNDYRKELLEIQAAIDATDREIDQMVYELYGLTDEEIKIVEAS